VPEAESKSAAEAQIRLAVPADLDAIVALTEAAYRPYTELLGRPPLPVTEDYAPHIEDGGVWLLELADELGGLIVLEKGADHLLIFSVAVAPAFQGKGLGVRLLEWAEEQTRKAGFGEVRLYTNARGAQRRALQVVRLHGNR
jgi:GNAT superfamily N-acetyltransferase